MNCWKSIIREVKQAAKPMTGTLCRRLRTLRWSENAYVLEIYKLTLIRLFFLRVGFPGEGGGVTPPPECASSLIWWLEGPHFASSALVPHKLNLSISVFFSKQTEFCTNLFAKVVSEGPTISWPLPTYVEFLALSLLHIYIMC